MCYMKHDLRDSTGRFRKVPKNPTIVSGRLYGYRGAVVRAGGDRQRDFNHDIVLRHVTFHKTLHGFVPESELSVIGKGAVKQYLQKA